MTGEFMIFDWDKAARMIQKRKPKVAGAGLHGNWGNTGAEIYSHGRPHMPSYTYLASTWAVPELWMDGKVYACYRMEHEVPEWDANTKWPNSALDILRKGDTYGNDRSRSQKCRVSVQDTH